MLNPSDITNITCLTISTSFTLRFELIHSEYTYQENCQLKLLLQSTFQHSLAKKWSTVNGSETYLKQNIKTF